MGKKLVDCLKEAEVKMPENRDELVNLLERSTSESRPVVVVKGYSE